MKISESKMKLIHKNQDKVVIGNFFNHITTDLIGGIWTDREGKIHYVGLIYNEGIIMPDFPKDETTYVSDIAAIGLKKGKVRIFIDKLQCWWNIKLGMKYNKL